ncbi:hypothetical protein G0P98_20050 [Yangia sp. PrR004]|nr:hypothetical protein [Salipiger sp. PrR004]
MDRIALNPGDVSSTQRFDARIVGYDRRTEVVCHLDDALLGGDIVGCHFDIHVSLEERAKVANPGYRLSEESMIGPGSENDVWRSTLFHEHVYHGTEDLELTSGFPEKNIRTIDNCEIGPPGENWFTGSPDGNDNVATLAHRDRHPGPLLRPAIPSPPKSAMDIRCLSQRFQDGRWPPPRRLQRSRFKWGRRHLVLGLIDRPGIGSCPEKPEAAKGGGECSFETHGGVGRNELGLAQNLASPV